MSDKRTHRGAHPDDTRLFAPAALAALSAAHRDFCWLLSHGYAEPSALKLVGDRYRLVKRQRLAVSRTACSDRALALRRSRQVRPEEMQGRELWIDGFNLLVTIEVALGGGVVLRARDGTYRDMASMHGTYRTVAESEPAIKLAGQVLHGLDVGKCRWYFDQPVSNSGRIQTLAEGVSQHRRWDWSVELAPDPDPLLAAADHTIVTADSVILDNCSNWLNLARLIVDQKIPTAWVIDLSGADDDL